MTKLNNDLVIIQVKTVVTGNIILNLINIKITHLTMDPYWKDNDKYANQFDYMGLTC